MHERHALQGQAESLALARGPSVYGQNGAPLESLALTRGPSVHGQNAIGMPYLCTKEGEAKGLCNVYETGFQDRQVAPQTPRQCNVYDAGCPPNPRAVCTKRASRIAPPPTEGTLEQLPQTLSPNGLSGSPGCLKP